MTQKDIDWVEKLLKEHVEYSSHGPKVLDIGSLDVNGSVRHLFHKYGVDYVGIDFREGPNVDIVMNAHDIDQFLFDFDTIVCLNTLEHDDAFWITLDNINKRLKQGGYFFFAIPTIGFPLHDHPSDYWRFTEQAIRDVVFKGFEVLDLQTVYTKEVDGKPVNPVIQCFGRKL